MKDKIKFIPCSEKTLTFNANHKTGKLKNSSIYNANQKRMRSIIRRELIKEIKDLQNGYISKQQTYKLRRLDYKGLISYAKTFKNKYLKKPKSNEQENKQY